MTKFVTPTELSKRFGLDDSVDSLFAALENCSERATEDLAGILRTSFDAVTGQTDFFSPRSMIRNGNLFEVKLKLSQGIVSQTGFTVNYGSSVQGLVDGSDSTMVAAPFLDPDKGVVTVYDSDFTGGDQVQRLIPGGNRSTFPGAVYIAVTYSAGLATADGLYTDAPDWMVNAAANLALLALDEDYPAYRGQRAADPTTLARRLARIQEGIFSRIRYVPNAEFPIGQ